MLNPYNLIDYPFFLMELIFFLLLVILITSLTNFFHILYKFSCFSWSIDSVWFYYIHYMSSSLSFDIALITPRINAPSVNGHKRKYLILVPFSIWPLAIYKSTISNHTNPIIRYFIINIGISGIISCFLNLLLSTLFYLYSRLKSINSVYYQLSSCIYLSYFSFKLTTSNSLSVTLIIQRPIVVQIVKPLV